MWPVIIGIGIAALIAEAFSDDNSDKKANGKGNRKRIFISFAIEDETYRNHLVNQARSEKSPFDFIDMSVKQPWNEEEWKKRTCHCHQPFTGHATRKTRIITTV